MTRHAKLALKIPALLVVVIILSHTSVTLGQCEVHEVAKLTASDAAQDDYFGGTVSVSGDVAVVGSYSDDCPTGPGTNCGSAYVYRFNGSSWVQQAKLTASDAGQVDVFGNGGSFGYSVSVHGDVAIVGAPRKVCAAGILCGSAYVYRFHPGAPGQWVEEQKLAASDAAAFVGFGNSVSVSGNVAVVGAVGDECGLAGNDCGAAYVYRFNGSTWVQQAKLTASDRAGNDFFGRSVSVSGDTAVVGADGDDCSTGPDTNCGSAYVYRFNGSSWVQQAKLTASDAAQNDRFGLSVSVSEDAAVVGASGGGGYSGSAYVYRFDGSTWAQEAKLTASDAALGDNFGISVSVSGDTTVVGAYLDDCATGNNCGSAYVFSLGSLPLPSDCNANGVADDCDTDCNANQVPDDCDIADGTSADCNGNNVPDECEPPADCNGNGIQDICDVAAGTSDDCNVNGVPDECESQADCNNNATQDICDIAGGTSLDCNLDEIPDECQLASNDCNENAIPDDCESPTDCNGNAIRDFCDIIAGTSEDCNSNAVPDECDVAVGTSTDANNNGTPDECDTDLPPFVIEQPVDVAACEHETVVFKVVAGGMTPFNYQWRKDTVELSGETSDTLTLPAVTLADEGDYGVVVTNDLGTVTSDQAVLVLAPLGEIPPDPTGINKNRFVSLSIPGGVGGGEQAVRVTLTSLHHVVPPYFGWSSIPFTAFEGQVRWVGPPAQYHESSSDPTTFMAATLQCQPHYQDWSTVGLLHVTGAEIVPSSLYDVMVFDGSCRGDEANCLVVSCPLTMYTTRWCDVVAPFNPPSTTKQPDFADLAALVNKFKSVAGAPIKVRAKLQPDDPDLTGDVDFRDIAGCVAAFKGSAYPYPGPADCP